ncbi:hypothetical protein [Pseudomonas koreensis]|uniref:Uncharacterized protein n=1 Tax=Pseudomonas koreensis TaxID=198620 RepID=A0A9X2XS34_9PSED|nr:hypothetical protein [Pseudomonas koreensis]MCU7251817.1 hypothetical protein [Pseudomonas koreensis]
MNRLIIGIGLLAALGMASVEAANQEIRALFQPDSSQPNKNVFVNKTPNSGYCAIYPAQCVDNNTFSIQLPIRFESAGPILPGTPGADIGLKVPANWRQLTVTNQATGESETVEIRITGIGSQYILPQSAASLVGVTDILEGHRQLWTNNSWVNAPAPCGYSGVGGYYPANYWFFWKAPVEALCIKTAAYRIPSMAFSGVDIAYELRTPNPLSMSSGLYTGSLTYTVGPAGDFQMGSMMIPNDSNITLDFVLDVQHTLKVELPPGGDKVQMEPEGGWHSWINAGKRPTAIYRDQQFFLSSSSRFKVMLLCDAAGTGATLCSMGGSAGHSRFSIKMILPDGIVMPAENHPGSYAFPLYNNLWTGPFEPMRYVDRKPGILRFYMDKWDIDFMLKPGTNGTMRGNATIIWDSEV